jgi:hypothetical protein
MPEIKLCAIHQPNLFPRLSTLAKLYAADTWVVLDDVQFNSRDYQHRCRLAQLNNPQAQQWLSLSVHRPHGQASRLNEVQLVERRKSQRRAALLIQQYYGRSPHWPVLQAPLVRLFDHLDRADSLTTVTEASTRLLLDLLGWPGQVVRSTDLPSRSSRSERLADLTAAVGGTAYLCGTGGRRYLDSAPFAAVGIAVQWFEPPAADGERFDLWASASRVSALWALMTVGADELRQQLALVHKRYL